MPYVTVQRGDPPTPRQAEALELIKKFQAEHGYAPTTRDMMALMGMKSPNAVMGHFKALEKRGLIVRDKNVSRGIRVVEEKPKDEPRVRSSLRRCPHCGKPI
jgi:repressor LexA